MADNDFISSPNTGATLETADTNSLRKLWKRRVEIHEQENDFYQQFEGNRTDSIIETVNDTNAGAGQRISFTSMAGFYQEGKHGDENFDSPTDYEKINIASNTLYVDFVRNGVRYNERMEEHIGLRRELTTKLPDELGKWMGRKKSRAIEMKWVRKAKGSAGYNLAMAGGGTSIDGLTGANVLGWEDIVNVGTILAGHGAVPAMAGRVGKNPIKRYLIVGGQVALRNLKTDDQYLAAQHEAGVDGTANILFTGGFSDVDGHMIVQRDIIDHDGDGPLGAPIAPKLRIAEEITAGTAGFTVTGGTNTKVLYTADFPNHAFKYNAADAETTATDPFYLLIVNPPNAPVDPGKMGFYKCVGNTGKAITITERLGLNGGGARNPTVGSVSWNTGVWADLHTEVHPAGAMAYLANAKGQPYGYTLFLGACSMRRGYGKYRNARSTDDKEGGFVQESYVTSVFGQEVKANVRQEFPNFMLLAHSLAYPGTPIPDDIV